MLAFLPIACELQPRLANTGGTRHRKVLETAKFSVFVQGSVDFSVFVLTLGASDDSMWIQGLVLLFLLARSLPISHELYRF